MTTWNSHWGDSGRGNGSYGYNSKGTAFMMEPSNSLGLAVPTDGAPTAIPENQVQVPSDMIAIGDGFGIRIYGFGWPGEPLELDTYRLDRNQNAVFCDGHVEASNSDTLPRTTSSDWGVLFKPDAARAIRWNRDHEPHPETWPHL